MNCCVCGKEIERSKYSNAVLCSSECYHIHFWNQMVKEKDEHIIIDGECYWDGGNKPSGGSNLGFAGRRFRIRYFDGREIYTNNLWYNGIIPESHKTLLPNNAEFCSPDEISKLEEYANA